MALKSSNIATRLMSRVEQIAGAGINAESGSVFRPISQSDVFKPRLVTCITGGQKRGRTHFGLTMPPPIAYIAIEPAGLEGVADKPEFKGKDISVTELKWERPTRDSKGSDRVIQRAEKTVALFERALDEAVRNFRSIITDTHTELWELYRTAEFGKLGEVKPHHYAEVNLQFKETLNRVLESNLSMAMIHRIKDEYKAEKNTGNKVRDGYRGAEYDAHVCLWMDRDYGPNDTNTLAPSGPFFFQVYDCRQNPSLVGQRFVQPDNTFLDLAMSVYPDSDPAVWGV